MVTLIALMLQSAQPAPAAPPPDIQLDANVTARRVVVENRGRASLRVRASVNGQDSDAGNVVNVEAPTLPQGQRELRNVRVHVRAETRLAPPANSAASQETPADPQR